MSDTTMEQKLRLVQQVRSRYQEDQYDMSDRERILYGKTSVVPGRLGYTASPYGSFSYGNPYREGQYPAEHRVSSFRVRLFLAVFLAMLVIIMDRNDMEVAGITPEKVYEVISADYEEVLETWAEALTQ